MTDTNVLFPLTSTGGGGGGSQVQADWNDLDSTSSAYINNKPFGYTSEGTVKTYRTFTVKATGAYCWLFESTQEMSELLNYIVDPSKTEVSVTFDGTEYTVDKTVYHSDNDDGSIPVDLFFELGNYTMYAVEKDFGDDGIPFAVSFWNGDLYLKTMTSETHTLSVDGVGSITTENKEPYLDLFPFFGWDKDIYINEGPKREYGVVLTAQSGYMGDFKYVKEGDIHNVVIDGEHTIPMVLQYTFRFDCFYCENEDDWYSFFYFEEGKVRLNLNTSDFIVAGQHEYTIELSGPKYEGLDLSPQFSGVYTVAEIGPDDSEGYTTGPQVYEALKAKQEEIEANVDEDIAGAVEEAKKTLMPSSSTMEQVSVAGGGVTQGNTGLVTGGQVYDFVIEKVPIPPTTDGTYKLTVTVSNGTSTYSWVAET